MVSNTGEMGLGLTPTLSADVMEDGSDARKKKRISVNNVFICLGDVGATPTIKVKYTQVT